MYDFKRLAERWPSAIVARKDVGKFSGGALHPRTLANRDSLGIGPKGRMIVNGHVAYPVESLITYLEERTGVHDGK